MGYDSAMFEEIGQLSIPSKTVLDIGAQDVSISSAIELDQLNRFIHECDTIGVELTIDKFPAVIEAREVYTKAGFTYTCIDVEERPGTLRIDLARFEIPHPRGEYGLVVNVGTTEHLASPAATFAFMHEMCTEGGILYHDVPLFGLGNHGLMNPTPKFWHALIWMNRYEVERMSTRQCDESALNPGNFYHDYLNYIEGLSDISAVSYMITAVLRKSADRPFVVPYDAVFNDDKEGIALANLLAGSYHPFIATGSYSEQEVVAGINSFLEMNGRTYRLKSLHRTDLRGYLGDIASRIKQLTTRKSSKPKSGTPAPNESSVEKRPDEPLPAEHTTIEPPAAVDSQFSSSDDAVTRVAAAVDSGEISEANRLADEAVRFFPAEWRVHQQKARALELDITSHPGIATSSQDKTLAAARHYFKAADLASQLPDLRCNALAFISQGRNKLNLADSIAAMSISQILLNREARPGLQPLLIALSTLPKSGSAYVWMSLANGLSLTPSRISTGVTGDDLLETIDAERIEKRMSVGGTVVHGHFAPEGPNLYSINKLHNLLVHVRDPRQTVLSWAHFMVNQAQIERQEHNNLTRVLSHLNLEDRIDWAIDYYLPRQIKYLQLWMNSVNQGLVAPKVKFLRQEDLVNDPKLYFHSILDFLGIEGSLFTMPSAPETGKLHYRSGATDEWRDAFSSEQLQLVQKRIPSELLEYFGWER